MKLDKAIEILTIASNYEKPPSIEDYVTAIKLGIEAMKYRLELEQTDPEITLEPLPGETED